ncbi:FmdB family zinc ribbon protein [Desulfohalovibrio reitneri]|uniref:FmdB family zinc ribbon protein n=1 Tax=Desulfohalovibrio reitneri TaxID=1307759 RepID=UPI0004A71728|nr:zinc ribbon domain-containing protein [Desulfohalovibrio reitneri]
MPLYEYACRACGHEFEDVRSMSDTTCPPCPQCGKESEKLLSAVALKGGATPFDGMDRVKAMHPASRPAGLNTGPGGGCKPGG